MAMGIGLGAFAQGLSQGLGTGIKLGNAWEAKKTRDNRQKAIDDAKTGYNKAIDTEIASQPGIDPAEARSNATNKVGSFTDFLYGTKLPSLIDSYTAAGDLEGAETMRKWGADAKERKFMDSFGKTLGTWAAGRSSGDYTPFAESAVKLLNDGGYGIKATGYDLIKDNDGKTTGLTFKLKEGDKEYSHTFNSIDDAAQFLSAQGSPANRVKQWQAEREAAIKLKSGLALKQADAQIGLNKDIALEGVKQKGRLDLQKEKDDAALHRDATRNKGSGNKDQQKDEYVAGLLRSRGFTDDDVNTYIASKYLGESYRKGKSPAEFAQQVLLELAKDPMITDKSPENLKKMAAGIVDSAIDLAKSQTQGQRPSGTPGAQGGGNTPARQTPPVFR